MMSQAEVRLFSRSSTFLSAWIAQLQAVSGPLPTTTRVTAAPLPTPTFLASAAPVVAATSTTATTPAPTPASAPAAAQSAPTTTAPPQHVQGQRRPKPEAPKDESTSMSKVNIVVGTVVDVAPHPEADGLWVEQIDIGEEKPRQILSGLRAHVTKEEFLGRQVVVVANLEPRKMRGIVSEGMVLCASDAEKKTVRLLNVPEGVPNGERITFPGHEGEAEPVLKKKLAKHYENIAGELTTNDNGVACYQGDLAFSTSRGPVTCTEMPNSLVS